MQRPVGKHRVVFTTEVTLGRAIGGGRAEFVAFGTAMREAKLIAEIAGRGAVDATWNHDSPSAKASLAALAADPDYVGSELTFKNGKVLASDGVDEAKAGALIVEKVPVIREEGGQRMDMGTLELRMSTARADAAIAGQTWVIVWVGLGALVVVCGFLFWILRSSIRPD